MAIGVVVGEWYMVSAIRGGGDESRTMINEFPPNNVSFRSKESMVMRKDGVAEGLLDFHLDPPTAR